MSIWTTLPANVMAPPSIPVLSVGNLKGGVGKTTVVANLAVALVQSGFRVLAIDLDFQASLSIALPSHIMPRHEKSDGGVEVLVGSGYDIFHDSHITGRGVGTFADLSLVRTSLELAEVEDLLFANFLLRKYDNDPRFALAQKLSNRRLKNDFDIVLIDTPPRLTIASINALCASTHVLIPTALTSMSLSGAVTFVAHLKKFQKALAPNFKILGVLPTMTHGTLNDAELRALKFLNDMLPNVEIWKDQFIPDRQAIADNNVLRHAGAREVFQNLAKKVAEGLGISPHGDHEDRTTRRSAQYRWTGLSE